MRALRCCLVAFVFSSLACDNPADKTQKAQTGDAKPVAGETVEPGATELKLSETSEIQFVGSKVTGSHAGGFKEFNGDVRVAGDEVVSASIEIDMASTYSDSEKLTGHLKSPDFFDTAKFPTAKFVTTAITPGAKAEKMPDATHTVVGNLTLHGETRSITFAAKISNADGKVMVKSEFAINRKDFGIVYAGRADDLIRDEVVIKLDVVASAG